MRAKNRGKASPGAPFLPLLLVLHFHFNRENYLHLILLQKVTVSSIFLFTHVLLIVLKAQFSKQWFLNTYMRKKSLNGSYIVRPSHFKEPLEPMQHITKSDLTQKWPRQTVGDEEWGCRARNLGAKTVNKGNSKLPPLSSPRATSYLTNFDRNVTSTFSRQLMCLTRFYREENTKKTQLRVASFF